MKFRPADVPPEVLLDRQRDRAVRYRAKAAAVAIETRWAPSPGDKLPSRQKCGRTPSNPWGVELVRYQDGTCGLQGVYRCHSVWECPLCAPGIAAGRRDALRRVVSLFERERQGTVWLLSLTVRHGAGDDLGELRKALMRVWSKVHQGAPYERMRERVAWRHYVRAVEVTHGRNGFHPHIHALLFLGRGFEWRTDRPWLIKWYWERWRRFCAKEGLPPPLRDRAVDLRRAIHADYVAKMGLADELTKAEHHEAKNGNVTPWQALRNYMDTRDPRWASVWHRYCEGMRGARQLTVSRSLSTIYAERERESREAQTLVTWEPRTWRDYRLRDIEELLSAAERGDLDAAEAVDARVAERAKLAPYARHNQRQTE